MTKPHYHAWRLADGETMFYRSRRFETRAAANQWVRKMEPDPRCRMVKACDSPKCRRPRIVTPEGKHPPSR